MIQVLFLFLWLFFFSSGLVLIALALFKVWRMNTVRLFALPLLLFHSGFFLFHLLGSALPLPAILQSWLLRRDLVCIQALVLGALFWWLLLLSACLMAIAVGDQDSVPGLSWTERVRKWGPLIVLGLGVGCWVLSFSTARVMYALPDKVDYLNVICIIGLIPMVIQFVVGIVYRLLGNARESHQLLGFGRPEGWKDERQDEPH